MNDHRVRETQVGGHAAVILEAPAAGVDATFVPGANMLGASLRQHGVEWLDPRGGVAAYLAHGSTMGIPFLYPWANRLGGFQYTAGGRAVDLAPHRPFLHQDPNGLPMHGLQPALLQWGIERTVATAAEAVVVATLSYTTPELLAVFPYPHVLTQTVRLCGERLTVATTVRPCGAVAVPVSFGFHPYFRMPDVPRAEWVLGVPARRRLALDARMLPSGASEAVDIPTAPLAARGFDDAFTDLATPRCFTLAGAVSRLAVEFEAGYPYAQIYAPPGEAFVCIEPMTARTNALVTGTDLQLVAPGEEFTAKFSVSVGAA